MKRGLLCLLIFASLASLKPVYAAEELDQESLQSVESVLEEQGSDISFTQIVKKLMSGDIKGSIRYLWKKLSGDVCSS